MTRAERDCVDRAFQCIKRHPELGRVYKKDLIPLESYSSEGLVRTVLVRDKYSKRLISCGETNGDYYSAEVAER
jgi:hypothetical protein